MNKQKTLCLGLTTLLLAGAMAAAETPVSADRQMSNDQTAKARRADDNFLGLQVRFLEQSGNGFVQYKMKLIDCGDVDNVQAEYSIFYRMRVGRGFYRTDSSEFFPLIPSKSDHFISSRWLWVSKSPRVDGVLLRLSRRNMRGELVVREFEEGRVPSEKERKKYKGDGVTQK